ncbi:plasma membrane heat shock protein [Sporothrix bragantina]|uniref:D-lactate dehydratase n=1 Tax=Sporothrix bragantina TaxID=671064 RepID=A0ABP0CSD9_9PEZI
MAPARRALIAVTSASAPIHNGKDTTGLFVTEALHPYNVLTAAGFEVDLASETGKYTADTNSLDPSFLQGEDRKIWEDANSSFRKKLDNMKPAKDLVNEDYGLFYASAGHASLIDYPTAHSLHEIAAQVWDKGGVVASVCHGPAIFDGLNDLKTREPLIKGKKITGFTTEGEEQLGVKDEIKTWGQPLVEELAQKLGATYSRAPGPWDDYHVVDGRLVTGQNPASATSTARAAVEVFEKL